MKKFITVLLLLVSSIAYSDKRGDIVDFKSVVSEINKFQGDHKVRKNSEESYRDRDHRRNRNAYTPKDKALRSSRKISRTLRETEYYPEDDSLLDAVDFALKRIFRGLANFNIDEILSGNSRSRNPHPGNHRPGGPRDRNSHTCVTIRTLAAEVHYPYSGIRDTTKRRLLHNDKRTLDKRCRDLGHDYSDLRETTSYTGNNWCKYNNARTASWNGSKWIKRSCKNAVSKLVCCH